MRQRTAAIGAGGVAVLALAALLVWQGGRAPAACTAIGYVETIDVHLSGDVALVDDVTLCSTAGCSLPRGVEPTPDPTDGLVHGPMFAEERVSAAEWRFAISGPRPTVVTVKATDLSGRTVATTTSRLAWRRAEPKSACNTSMKTPPIGLRVPAT